jgi:predicted Zn-dependent protease
MRAASGQKPPEFLSTHPHETNRIEKLRELLPEAMQAYEQLPKQYGLGERW